MLQLRLLFLSFFFVFTNVFAQYSFDTLESRQLAPGVEYKRLRAPSVPLLAYMLKVDLQNPKVKIETIKAMDMVKQFKLGATLVGPIPILPLSQMVTEHNQNNDIIAAVNGDFFSQEGRPYNIQIIKNQLLQIPTNSVVLGFDKMNNAYLGRVTFSASLTHRTKVTKIDSTVAIDGINNFRQADQMWFYNGFNGSEFWPDSMPRSGQNRWAPEMIVEPITEWKVNDTVKVVVRGVSSLLLPDTVNRYPVNWACLSQHRNNDDWLARVISPGDTFRLVFNVKPVAGMTGLSNPSEMIGGSPQIVKNGQVYVNQGYIDEGIVIDPTKPHHSKELHPRTVAGLSADRRYLYLIVVDGGQPNVSKGVTLTQMAEILVSFGISNAMNLDGGENSTMVLGESGVVNSPSLGSEMSISNAIFIRKSDASSIGEDNSLPTKFALSQNYPNPFNPTTNIEYFVSSKSFVTLKIYDMLGREIEILTNDVKEPGKYSVQWNAGNYSSGIYYYKMEAGDFRSVKKMLLIK